ncbi:MAG: EAL domain-containing protein [Lachnospiraceae bacterium]|nr:EAL domain-containing protein [Lachnospiraceae bacterium]
MDNNDLNKIYENMDDIQREYEGFLMIKNKLKPWLESFIIIIKYIIMGVLWIILSDKMVSYIVEDTEALEALQLYKGWFYVFATGVIFFLIIRRALEMYSDSIDKILTGYEELFLAHEELMSMNEDLVSMNEDLRKYIDTIEVQKKEIQISEQRYELAVEGANDGIWDWDIKTDVYFLPRKWKNMLGYDDDELKNSMDCWGNLFHPDDKEQVMLILHDYLNKKADNYHSTFRVKSKSGEYRWILSRGKCLWDENGQPVRMSGSHSDITEYMQLQELLWAEKELSNSIIMDASSIIIVFDTEERIIQFNPFAEKTFGFKKEEVIGKIGGEVLTSTKEKTIMREMFRHILDGNSLKDDEIDIKCKDGTFKTILWNNNILHDEKGNTAGLVSIGTDISERREMEDKLKLIAYYDSLTGLPNLAYLEKMASEMILKDEKFAIVNMDIDNFKQINDTMGHSVGDNFIQYIANILNEAIEEPSIVARLGGDEFALLLNLEEKQKLIDLLKQIQSCIKNPWNINGQKFHITSSMGVAVYPEHGNDVSALMQNADIAMFYQKEHGRDGYAIFKNSMYEKIFKNLNMSNMLKEAITNDEFMLYYQPQIDMVTGRVVGVEALIRWNNPQKGFIPPAEFIPYSEQTGYIIPISEWVLKKAITQKRDWESKGYPQIKMAVNLSGYIFTEDSTFDSICSILNSMNIKPGELEVEVTETAVMMELDKAQISLNELKAMGISIAMDDFGTGYSSLNYLQILPFDILKIDRGFIQNLTNKKQTYIYQTVVELAHSLGLIVVAEGIETVEQKDFLIMNSCDIGQGYYFSKPVPAFEIEKLFEKNF